MKERSKEDQNVVSRWMGLLLSLLIQKMERINLLLSIIVFGLMMGLMIRMEFQYHNQGQTMLISKLYMKHLVNKFLIMLGKVIIAVYSLMDKQDQVKVTQWLVMVKIRVSFLYLSKKFSNVSKKPKMKIKNIKFNSLCLKFIMKKYKIY